MVLWDWKIAKVILVLPMMSMKNPESYEQISLMSVATLFVKQSVRKRRIGGKMWNSRKQSFPYLKRDIMHDKLISFFVGVSTQTRETWFTQISRRYLTRFLTRCSSRK